MELRDLFDNSIEKVFSQNSNIMFRYSPNNGKNKNDAQIMIYKKWKKREKITVIAR
jgi:hypothetical protein